MDTFLSGKHLNEVDFVQTFKQMTNQQMDLIHQLEQKQGPDNVWCNGDVQMHELDNVINKLHNTACSSDENKFHPKMIVKSGPKFRTCLVNLFKSCLQIVYGRGLNLVFFLIRNFLNQAILIPLHIDLSA